MLDNQILEVLFPLVEGGVNNMLVSMGYNGNASCQASYQPTREGVTSIPSIYIFKVAPDVPYGMPTYQNVYNPEEQITYEVFIQRYTSTFQFSARVLQNASNIKYTASDLVNMVRIVLLQSSSIATLKENGLEILKPGSSNNPFYLDDRNQFEGAPSFDLEFTHIQQVNTPQNQASGFVPILIGI